MPELSKAHQLTFVEHLEELRKRLILIFAVLFAGLFISIFFSDSILAWLLAPTRHIVPKLYFLAPHEAFWIKLKISFFASLVFTLPHTIYQLAAFIAPGLRIKERRASLEFIAGSSALFISGALFSHYFVNPVSLKFLLSFQSSGITPLLSVSEFLNFIIFMSLGFGIAFILPVVLLALMKIGLFGVQSLKKFRPTAVILSFIIGAGLTPPDVFSQILMSVPLVLLYELTILAADWQDRRKSAVLSGRHNLDK